MDPQKSNKSLVAKSCMFLHPNNNSSICYFMVDNSQEGKLLPASDRFVTTELRRNEFNFSEKLEH